MRTADKKARDLVTSRMEFIGSNTFGVRFSETVYGVFSYGFHFPFFVFDGQVWFENSDRYSVTTSKHKNQLRPVTESNIIKADTEKLKRICGIQAHISRWAYKS